MRYDIQFAKIDVNKNARMKKTMLAFFGFLILSFIALFSVLSVRAYFTATAKKNGNLKFGTIEVALTNTSGNAITASSFKTAYLSDVMPGSTLSFTDIKVKNTGTFAEYVLLNLDVEISGADSATTLHYNEWYNVDGEQVDVANMAINETKPTLIASGSSATANINWKVPGEPVGNEYLLGTTKVSITAYASQTYLADAVAYADAELYASYFIVKNAPSIAQDYELTYTGTTPTSDPLRKLVTSKNLFDSSNWVSGSINATSGQNISGAHLLRNDDYFSIEGGQNYVASCSSLYNLRHIYLYDAQKNLISAIWTNRTSPYQFQTPNDARYFRVVTELASNTSNSALTQTDVTNANASCNFQIEKGTTSTTYQAYSEIVDTYDSTTNTVTRNVGKMEFTGTESWREMNMTSNYERFVLAISDIVPSSYAVTNICETDNPNAWNSYKFVFQVDSESNIRYYRPFYTGFLKGVANNANWKTWLRERNANGDPVTVWYVLTTPTTETVLTSKNLYNGVQNLYFDEIGRNCNSSAEVSITSNAEQNLAPNTSAAKELGKSVFDYVQDKPITISAKVKRYENDLRTGTKISIVYKKSDASTLWYSNFINKVETDEEWHYIYTSAPSIKSLVVEVTQIKCLFFASAGDNESTHFEAKDIQIEVGESPTDFERYDPTVYQRVNGVALREVNGVKDTYNASTKTITRNIGKVEFTGDENWVVNNWPPEGAQQLSLKISYIPGMQGDIATTTNSHFSNATSNTINSATIGGSYNMFPSNEELGFIDSLEKDDKEHNLKIFKDWLKEQYNKGNPVTVWYVLATATTETLS